VCWNPLLNLLQFKAGSCLLGTLTSAQNPLLIYMTRTLTINGDLQYSGAAIFLVAPSSASGVTLNNNITTPCVVVGPDLCGRTFPNDPGSPSTTDMLAILTTANSSNGFGNMAIDGHNGDNIMGAFYTGAPVTAATGGTMTISKQLNVVGSVVAAKLVMP